jgi:hypothetical protein
MIDVPDVRKEFRRQVYQTLGLVLAALVLLAVWQRKRLAFYAGAWA